MFIEMFSIDRIFANITKKKKVYEFIKSLLNKKQNVTTLK